jgi:hypothetical protein
MNEKKIGKITSVQFGLGGYQDCQFGLSLTFESNKDKWGCGTFIGNWDMESIKWNKESKWTEKDRSKWNDDLCRKVSKILNQAKVSDISKLKDIPVEVEFEGNMLKNWRILEEAL